MCCSIELVSNSTASGSNGIAWIGLQRVNQHCCGNYASNITDCILACSRIDWVDETQNDYRNWAPGQPNNQLHLEKCCLMYTASQWENGTSASDYYRKWDDHYCRFSDRYSFVCKSARNACIIKSFN